MSDFETLVLYGKGFYDGQEKGRKNMWQVLCKNGCKYYEKNAPKNKECFYKETYSATPVMGIASLETCPIAQKLLKGVGK